MLTQLDSDADKVAEAAIFLCQWLTAIFTSAKFSSHSEEIHIGSGFQSKPSDVQTAWI